MTDEAPIKTLSGPIVKPASGKDPEQIVIFLHGVGSDGQDLIQLSEYFNKVLPNAVFVSPNAPHPFDGGPPELPPSGYQWFSLRPEHAERRWEGMQEAAVIINNFIDVQTAEYGLQPEDVALVGFSQGTMMALHVGLRREQQLAGIVGYSGALIGSRMLDGEIRSRPPVLMVNGAMDVVVAPDVLDEAETALKGVGVEVVTMMRPNLGHGLDDEGVKAGMGFLARVFQIDLRALVG